ncbi:MAG TPA: hypothetical protein VG501_08440 [Rhizomicrobium sp.]|nr:hypothetical protein [Rhizomicrobium sp.]
MDGAHKYVTEQNISRFMSALEHEADPAQRSVLTRLLIAEEDRFGRASERLEIAQQCLEKCSQRIAIFRARIDALEPDHPLCEIARRTLANMLAVRKTITSRIAHLKKATA